MEGVSKVIWQLTYDTLWLRFKNREFTFENALEVIFDKKSFDNNDIKYGSKLLNELQDRGYAIDRKADYDQRARLYRLLHPEMVSNAWAIFDSLSKEKREILLERILEGAKAFASWDYLFIGDAALARWSNNYYSVEVLDVSVLQKVLDGWISLLKLFGFQIIVDGILVSEAKTKRAQNAHLHSDLEHRLHQKDKEYQNLHYAIIEGIRENNIGGSLATLYVQRKKVKWKILIDIATKSGVLNRLGFLLETLNFEAEKMIFDSRIISKVFSMKSPELEVIEAKGQPYRTGRYGKMEDKWHVRCEQEGVFRKIIEDLIE